MSYVDDIRNLLSLGKSDEAISLADRLMIGGCGGDAAGLANLYYLRGNAHGQKGELGAALNSYLEAISLEPDGPAREAYRALQQVMEFYDKDRYNP